MAYSLGRIWKSGLQFIEHPGLRYYKRRGKTFEDGRNLAQRLQEMRYQDPNIHYRVNIGLPVPKTLRKEVMSTRLKHYMELKKNQELELAAKNRKLHIDLDGVNQEWINTNAFKQIYEAAQYYNVFEDLFGEAYFYPIVPLKVLFEYEPDQSLVTPVYRGNLIKPAEASKKPEVYYPADDKDLYTLMLTTPDGHLTDEKGEYLHWLVGNIPGNKIDKGDELCDYIRPFPPKGVGYCRYVFVLFKQDKKIDFTKYRRESPCTNLTARTFSTYDFYRDLQEDMTPAGVSFFQSDWDRSLTAFYQDVLEMKEPVVEYDFDPFNLPDQKWYPWNKPFNLYMDKYKEPQELGKELLIEKLKERHPFERPAPPPKYPLAFKIPSHLPSWLKDDIRRRRVREGKWKYM